MVSGSQKLAILALCLLASSCGGFQSGASGTYQAANVASVQPVLTPSTDSFQNLRVQYTTGASQVVFRHHSGDTIYVFTSPNTQGILSSNGAAPDPYPGPNPGPVGPPVSVQFFAGAADATDATQISILNDSTRKVLTSEACGGNQCGIVLNNSFFSQTKCASSSIPLNQDSLNKGTYQIQITYANGSTKESTIVVGDPCGNYFAMNSPQIERKIASVDGSPRSPLVTNFIWMLVGIFGVGICMFFITLITNRTK